MTLADEKHLLDLFELLYHWHDGPAGNRAVMKTVEEYRMVGDSSALLGEYAQLRGAYLRGRHVHQPAVFTNYAVTLAQSCVIELDPADLDQCDVIGEMVRPNFANARCEALGRRWIEDAVATAWRIAVPASAEEQRGHDAQSR